MEQRQTLLIIDDSASNIEFISEIFLESSDVHFAKSGAKALALLEAGLKPHIILLDVVMPQMNGYEFCREVKRRERHRDIPIIFITASDDEDSETNALKSGAVDFIQKPFKRDVLIARIDLHLRLIRSRNELQELNGQLKATVDELERSRDRLQVLATAIDNSPTSIVITDLNSCIEYVNPSYSRTTGYSLDEVKGKKPSVLRSMKTPRTLYSDLWENLLAGKSWSGEFVNLTREGREYREEAHIAPVKNSEGAVTHYVSVQMDVTARYEAESIIRRAKQKEMEFWALIQKDLLFGRLPDHIMGFNIACHQEASQIIDGDFFSLTRFGEHSFEILFGDVMGKGMTAALVGAGVKNLYRETIADLLINEKGEHIPDPQVIINELNSRVADTLIDLGVFVTLAVVRFNPVLRQVTYVNAGHTPILHFEASTGTCHELLGENLPLGVLKDEIYTQFSFPVDDRDLVCVYSDGVTESEDVHSTQFGMERLVDLVAKCGRGIDKSVDGMLKDAVDELVRFRSGQLARDDSSLIMVRAFA